MNHTGSLSEKIFAEIGTINSSKYLINNQPNIRYLLARCTNKHLGIKNSSQIQYLLGHPVVHNISKIEY